MKILHLIWDDLDNPWIGGGGAVRTHEINKRIASRHEVTVLTGNFPNSSSVRRDDVMYRRIGWGQSHFLSLVTYSFSIPFHIRRHKFDLVIDDFCAYSPAFAPLYTRKPVIALMQNLFGVHTITKHKFIGFLAYLFETFGIHLYRRFICVSPHMEREIRRRVATHSKTAFIANAPDAVLFSTESAEDDFILFLGRLELRQKGLDILIKSFAVVAQAYPRIKLRLAGPVNGKDKEKLDSMIEALGIYGRVEFVGSVWGQEKASILSRCLFVCMPSRYEGWPIVAMEAAACEKPVIGSNIPGIRDIVRHEETGLLVPTDNPQMLSEAMMHLIGNAELRQRLGRNARQWASDFTWDELAKRQEAQYVEMAKT